MVELTMVEEGEEGGEDQAALVTLDPAVGKDDLVLVITLEEPI